MTANKRKFLASFFLLPIISVAMSTNQDRKELTLLELNRPWYIVNDTVMGGISTSQVEYQKNNGSVRFTGQLSLENNGGFASTRTSIETDFFSGASSVCVTLSSAKVRTYQVRLRPSLYLDGVAYVQDLTVTDELQTFRLAFKEFVPRFRGQDLRGYSRVPQNINGEDVRQLTFMVADKNITPFELVVHRIASC